jgi:hypothetical protein
MTVKIAIQCKDARTRQTGTFGYLKQVEIFDGSKGFYSVTPVFPDMVGLFEYCNQNDIQHD